MTDYLTQVKMINIKKDQFLPAKMQSQHETNPMKTGYS